MLRIRTQYNEIRHEEGAQLNTIFDYLDYIAPIHTFILQIPPASESTSMRSSFCLRLTLELFEHATSYPLPVEEDLERHTEALGRLHRCLGQFDEGWFAILTSRAWDAKRNTSLVPPATLLSVPILDITTRTVLHSAILSGLGAVDDWLCDHLSEERYDIREKFSEVFGKTMVVLEGAEEGVEEFGDDDIELEGGGRGIEVDEELDIGMFHGFDDL